MDNSAAPVARKMCRGCRTEKDIGQFHDLRENPPRKFDEPGPRFTGDDQETPLLAEDMATKREFDEALAAEKMQRCLRCKERWFDIKLMADGVCNRGCSHPPSAAGLHGRRQLMFKRAVPAVGQLCDHCPQALDAVAGVDPSEELSGFISSDEESVEA
ncbi:predicted protein [Chaetomium globosum CBS 148.51]|uniref:Uncharacterized protein n=1 Tax=Chaetomium globosum (strain ATCC 6205 / CBS 148.51 / DSM 1962 / NBRC 6347 / NRRL 1970) TaxID=306901 RepID=Q2H2X9_CHAGB|nr:uncharacterized protein CHGG_03867 [Chaetomium globosum CBS 148.51]EAQ87248.1 predicted protein [Chaetomium globosum CBS 148.51]